MKIEIIEKPIQKHGRYTEILKAAKENPGKAVQFEIPGDWPKQWQAAAIMEARRVGWALRTKRDGNVGCVWMDAAGGASSAA